MGTAYSCERTLKVSNPANPDFKCEPGACESYSTTVTVSEALMKRITESAVASAFGAERIDPNTTSTNLSVSRPPSVTDLRTLLPQESSSETALTPFLNDSKYETDLALEARNALEFQDGILTKEKSAKVTIGNEMVMESASDQPSNKMLELARGPSDTRIQSRKHNQVLKVGGDQEDALGAPCKSSQVFVPKGTLQIEEAMKLAADIKAQLIEMENRTRTFEEPRKDLLNCYRNNPGNTLACREYVTQFSNFVNSHPLHSRGPTMS